MQKCFQARLESLEISLPWVVVRLPFDPVEAWPNHVKLHVRGTIRSPDAGAKAFPFATSLQSSQKHGYMLLVNEKMRRATRLSVGALAEIVLEADLEGRAATPPPELARLLKANRSVRQWFEVLSYSIRKYIADSILEPKSPEVRKRRAEQWVERMMLTMEGELSPPPVLRSAFRRHPQAQAGWDALTPNQRRLELFSIFSCASPEAQAKRVERTLERGIKAVERASARSCDAKPASNSPNR